MRSSRLPRRAVGSGCAGRWPDPVATGGCTAEMALATWLPRDAASAGGAAWVAGLVTEKAERLLGLIMPE